MTRALLALLVACGSSKPEDTAAPTTAPPDTEQETADTMETGETDAPDTEETDPTDTASESACAEPPVLELSARPHDAIGSLLVVSWEQLDDASVWVEYSVDDGVWSTTPPRDLGPGPQEQLVLGAPYDMAVTWRLVADCGDGPLLADDQVTTTGPIPPDLPLPTVLASDPAAWGAGDTWLYTSVSQQTGGWSAGDFWKVILDRQGRVVWALLTEDAHWTIWAQPSRDGRDLMWDDATEWAWGSTGPGYVHRMKIDGTIVESVQTEGLHHAWVELDDGTIAWGRRVNNSEEYLDLRHPDGAVETVWRCSDFELEQLGTTGTSCHSNAWYWHEATDTFLVSFPSTAGIVRDTVLHIDATGATLQSWGLVSDWSFDPPISQFDYQHGVSFLADGHLLLSTKLPEFHPLYDPRNDTLAAREYALDAKSGALREVWSFGEDQGIAGNAAGEAHRLANGHTLHNFGTGARVREITPDGVVVWDLAWEGGDTDGPGRLIGRSTFVPDLYAFAP
jgi:hypothetical protein